MSSVEIPLSVAAVLPTLSVFDITNDVVRELHSSEVQEGIAFVRASSPTGLVRVSERETGLFEDVETLLTRVLPVETAERERLLLGLLGPRTEQIPIAGGTLCLGTWQRILLFGLNCDRRADYSLTVLG